MNTYAEGVGTASGTIGKVITGVDVDAGVEVDDVVVVDVATTGDCVGTGEDTLSHEARDGTI